MAKRKRCGLLVLSTNQEIIPERNAINAHAQALMGNAESLLPILKAFSKCILSPHSFRNASRFQPVCTSRTVCCSEVVFPVATSPPHRSRPPPSGSSDHHLVVRGLFMSLWNLAREPKYAR